MSNTRHAKPGGEMSDERYASDPLLCKGLKAGDVVRRCETLDPAWIETALFLQYASNLPGSLDKLAADLLAEFPERIGSASMHKLHLQADDLMGSKLSAALEECDTDFSLEIFRRSRWEGDLSFGELLDIFRKKFLADAPVILRRFCLDPAFQIERLKLDSFRDLSGALLSYLDRWEKRTLAALVVTEIGAKVIEALDYAEQEKALVLVEGFARTGKTFVAKAWCAARPGKRRIASLSEATSDKEFFQEIAKSLGSAASLGFKASELRLRVNEVLRPGFLTFVIDEAHFLWPQRNLREASPRRIEWVRASLSNYGVSVAMISTHQFTKAQQIIEKNTHWSSEQLVGRIDFRPPLPAKLVEADIAAVVRYHLPEADDDTIDTLIGYVQASKKRLACIDHVVRAARHSARKGGRVKVTSSDVLAGFENTVLPSDRNVAGMAEPSQPDESPKHRLSKVNSTPLKRALKPISAPVPERDSDSALIGKSDRQSVRSIAGLSPAEVWKITA